MAAVGTEPKRPDGAAEATLSYEDGVGEAVPEPSRPTWELGSEVGNYVIEGQIGSGGFATVYRARHLLLASEHALKVLTRTDPALRMRLITEARIQAQLRHPNLVPVSDVLDVPSGMVLVMELVNGPSLAQWLGENRPEVAESERMFRGIVEGVQAAHALGVVHRDLKPANVLLDGEAHIPRVTDFGIARQVDGIRQTRTGMTMGTPAYMAPEQSLDSKRVDARADVFSLGCILYELLCGERAFPGSDPVEVISRIRAGTHQPLRARLPELSDALLAVVEACLQVERNDRPGSAGAILQLLDGVGPSSSIERSAIRPGAQLSSYRLETRLGQGGMGEVWAAWHQHLDREVALKLIRPDLLANDQAAENEERFRREAKATAALRSPHTVQIHDFGVTEAGLMYSVMELLHGQTLRELVERGGPQPPGRVIGLLAQICSSLEEAHQAGIVHRDIKPSNIFLLGDIYSELDIQNDHVKLLDFGLAKLVAAEDKELTGTSASPGTPAFMSPEAVRGQPVDGRSDLYALGCVGHYLLTGRLLFEGDNVFSVQMAHVQEEPPSVSSQSPHAVPGRLEDVLRRCLAKDPSDRPQSARQLRLELERLDPDAPASTPAREGRLVLVGVLTLAVLAAVLTSAWWMSPSAPDAAPAVDAAQPTEAPVSDLEATDVVPKPPPAPERICYFRDADTLLDEGLRCCDLGDRAPAALLEPLGCTSGYMCLSWGEHCSR